MEHTIKSIGLSSGKTMPIIGFGVYKCSPGEECYNVVLSALKCGYRHIDTAQFYNNEGDVVLAVLNSGINRSEIFITTKLKPSNFGYEKAISCH